MPRESAEAKGRRYLVEGRLVVREVSTRSIGADCRGDGTIHRLGWNGADGWWCDCRARTRSCSHLVALRLITTTSTRAGAAPALHDAGAGR